MLRITRSSRIFYFSLSLSFYRSFFITKYYLNVGFPFYLQLIFFVLGSASFYTIAKNKMYSIFEVLEQYMHMGDIFQVSCHFSSLSIPFQLNKHPSFQNLSYIQFFLGCQDLNQDLMILKYVMNQQLNIVMTPHIIRTILTHQKPSEIKIQNTYYAQLQNNTN